MSIASDLYNQYLQNNGEPTVPTKQPSSVTESEEPSIAAKIFKDKFGNIGETNADIQYAEKGFAPNPTYNLSDENTETKFNNAFEDWWNELKQSWDQTQLSSYQSKKALSQDVIDKNVDVRKNLDALVQNHQISRGEYENRMRELDEADKDAFEKVQSAQEGIDTNQSEIANEYVSREYKLNQALVNGKGADAGLGEALQYSLPSGLGSQGAMMAEQLVATFGKELFKRAAVAGVEAAGITSETGPGAIVAGTAAFLGQLGLGLYARYSETQSEIGDNVESAKAQLLDNWFAEHNPTHDPEGMQPSEEDMRQIRMQSVKGVDDLFKENMSLFGQDALEMVLGSSLFKGSSLIKGLDEFGQYNKYTRAAKTLGYAYQKNISEKFEEGFQYAAGQRQQSKALNLDDYEDKGFMSNLLTDGYDTLSSINYGLPYQKDTNLGGRYAENKEFQSSSEIGGLLGILGGGATAVAKATKDISTYLDVSKDLKNQGVIDPDSKVFKLKSDLYLKHFENGTVPYLLEGIRNLVNTKDDKGLPLMTQEQATEETRNIVEAYSKYKEVNEHLGNVSPDSMAGFFRSPEQKLALQVAKSELLHTSLLLTKYQHKLPIVQTIDNINNLIGHQEDIIKSIKNNIGDKKLAATHDLNIRLQKAETMLSNLNNEKAMWLKGSELTEADLPETSSIEQSNKNKQYLINELNISQVRDNYNKLLKIKGKNGLMSWFNDKIAQSEIKEEILNPEKPKDTSKINNVPQNAKPSGFDALLPEVNLPEPQQFKARYKNEYEKLVEDLRSKNTPKEIHFHYERINKFLNKVKKQIEANIAKFAETPVGEYYKNTLKTINDEIEINKSKIEKYKADAEEDKTNSTHKILDAATKFVKLFTGFLTEPELKNLNEMHQAEIYNEAIIKIEDYDKAGEETLPKDFEGKEITNSKVKIKSGLVSNKLKGKGVYVYVNGNRIGGLLDPRRFTIDGKPFNPGNMKHLEALNPDFVAKNAQGILAPTDQGKAVQDTYKAMVDVFKILEEKGEFTNEEVRKYFFVDRTGSIKYTKDMASKPSLNTIANEADYAVEYSYTDSLTDEKNSKKGVPIFKFKNGSISQIFVRDENGNIREVNKDKQSDEFNTLTTLFNERKAEIEKGTRAKTSEAETEKKKLTGQFFVLVNNPTAKSKHDILSANTPNVEVDVKDASVVYNQLVNLHEEMSKKLKGNEDEVKGTTLQDGDGNTYFISSEGVPGATISIGISGRTEDKRSEADKANKVKDTRKIGKLNVKIELPNNAGKITLFSKNELDGIGKGELNIFLVEDEGETFFIRIDPFNDKVEKLNNTKDLLNAINKDIALYSKRKDTSGKTYAQNAKLKGLKLLNFKVRVDEETSSKDFNGLNNLQMNAIPVRSDIKFTPKGVDKAASDNNKKQIQQDKKTASAEDIEIIESFISKINNASEEKLEVLYNTALNYAKENKASKKYLDNIEEAYSNRLNTLKRQSSTNPTKVQNQVNDNKVKAAAVQLEINRLDNQIIDAELRDASKEEIEELENKKEALQKELNNLALNGSDENGVWKIGEVTPTSNPIDIEQAKSRLKKILPSWISTQFVDTISNNLGENNVAWGKFINDVIYLSKFAEKGTEYHEAFHAVFRTILTPSEYRSLLNRAKEKYSKPSEEDLIKLQSYYDTKFSKQDLIDLYYEEKLADDFQKYAVNEDNKNIFKFIWDKIKNLIRFFYDNRSEIDTIFHNIYNGVYKNAEPIMGVIRRSDNPAFKLIPKVTKFNTEENKFETGFLSQAQSERIINTIALNTIKNNSAPEIEDIELQIANILNHYTVSNFADEIRKVMEVDRERGLEIAKEIKEINEAIKDRTTKKAIIETVKDRIALFNYVDNEDRENTEDESNDDGYIFNQSTFTIGGWGTLSKEMKQFIAFSEIAVDEFGFNNYFKDEEMKSSKFNMASNPFIVYTGVERILTDVPKNKVFQRFIAYANKTEHAKGFKDNLIRAISDELGQQVDENTSLDILKNSNWYNKFVTAFTKNKDVQSVVLFDPTNKTFKAFKANQKDEAIFQFDEWSKAFISLNRQNPIHKDSNIAILDGIKKIFISRSLISGKDDEGNIYNLSSTVNDVISSFKKLGIELSEGYIRHSLIANQIEFINNKLAYSIDKNDQTQIEYFSNLLKEFNTFDEIKGMDVEDIDGLIASINTSNNPFKTSVDEDNNVIDTGAIGRLKDIASSNALFDESVTGSTFQNAKGDTVYDKILPSYLTTESAKWRDSVRREFIQAVRDGISDEDGWKLLKDVLEEEGNYMHDYLVKSFYQSIKNNPLILGIEYEVNADGKTTNNIIYNNELSNLIFDNIKTNTLSGLRSVSFSEAVDEEGDEQFVLEQEGYKGSNGQTFADLDPRSKTVMSMSLFAKGKSRLTNNNNKLRVEKTMNGEGTKESRNRSFAPILFGVIEVKSTQKTVLLPVNKFVDKDGKLNSLGKTHLFQHIKQEYERINKVQNEINQGLPKGKVAPDVFVLEGYHTGKAPRGLEFFNFKYLNRINPELYKKLIDAAKNGEDINKFQTEIETALSDFYDFQFNRFLNLLVKRGVITQKTTTENGVETTTYYNSSLPLDYQFNNNELNLAAVHDYFSNDYINSMNFNNLLHGDLATNYKNHNDMVKRNAKLIASGPSLGTDKTTVSVVKSVKAKDRGDFKLSESEDINDLENTDTTDAQNKNTLDWYQKKYLLGLGKSNPKIKELFSKMRRGIKLNWAESQYLINSNASLTPRKIVGADTFFYDKTSTITILRANTSYVETDKDRKALDAIYDKIEEELFGNNNKAVIAALYKETHKYWKPLPSNTYNHHLLNALEANSIDILIYDSAMKQIKPNVTEMPKAPESHEDFILNGFDVSDTIFREQVNTDGSKKTGIDPTQTMNLIWSEQDRNTKVTIYGKNTTVGEIQDAYVALLGKRVVNSLNNIRKAIMEGDKPKYDKLLNEFAKSLGAQNADPYIQEFFRKAEGLSNTPKYNLNFPATLTKFENMWLAYVGKALKIKAPMHKFSLVSDHGVSVTFITENGKERIITDKEFLANPKKFKNNLESRRLKYSKLQDGSYLSECKIPAQFAEQFNLKVGDTIPQHLLKMLGVRIPTQDKQSMVNLIVVDFLPAEYGNAVILPLEIVKLSGADFDIDSLFVRIFDWYNNKTKNKIGYFGQYLQESTKSAAVAVAHDEYLAHAVKHDSDFKSKLREALSTNVKFNTLSKGIKGLSDEIFAMIAYNKELSNEYIKAIKNDFEEKLLEAQRETFEFDEDDNYIQQYSDASTGFDEKTEKAVTKLLIAIAKKSRVDYEKEIKAPLEKMLKDLKDTKTQISNEVLESLGYSVNEKEFETKFGKQVRDNVDAFNDERFSDIQPLNKGEIDNLLLEMSMQLSHNQGNKTIANTPSTTKMFDEADNLLKANELEVEEETLGVASPYDKMVADENNTSGAKGIGPAAVFNVMFQRLNKFNIKLRKGFDSILGLDNFSSYNNTNGDRINDNNSTILTVHTDNAKDPKAGRYNISMNTEGILLNNNGMGMNPTLNLFLSKQNIISIFNRNLDLKKSELSSTNEKKRDIASIIEYSKQQILDSLTLNKDYKYDETVELSVSNLIEAMKFAEGKPTTMTPEQYANIQIKTLDVMAKQKEYADFLRNFTDILGLIRGTKKTWNEAEQVFVSLKKLGIEIFLKKGADPYEYDSYDFKHVNGFEKDETSYPFDLLPIIKNDKLINTNLLVFNVINKYGEKFFISKTKTAEEIKDVVKNQMRDGYFDYDDNRSKFNRSLISYLNIKAFKFMNKVNLQIDNLFNNKTHKQLFSLLSKDEFANNELLKFLNPTTTDYTDNKRSIFEGLTLYKLEGNTRTKNNPDFVVLLMDGFRQLANSNDVEARDFAKNLFNYLIVKDNLQFKNNSFVRQIEPHFLHKVSKSLDVVQDLLSNDVTEHTFKETFGVSKEELIREFTEVYMRDSTNAFNLKSVVDFDVAKKMKDAVLTKLTSKEEVDEMTAEEKSEAKDFIDRSTLEENAPLFFDRDENGRGIASIDIFKNTKFAKGNEDQKSENSRLVKANISALLSIKGLFEYNEDTKLIKFPLVFYRRYKVGDSTRKVYYILKSYKTKVTKDGKTKYITLPANNLNGTQINEGVSAEYAEISTVGSYEIAPYAFSPKEWNDFINTSKLLAKEESQPSQQGNEINTANKLQKSEKMPILSSSHLSIKSNLIEEGITVPDNATEKDILELFKKYCKRIE